MICPNTLFFLLTLITPLILQNSVTTVHGFSSKTSHLLKQQLLDNNSYNNHDIIYYIRQQHNNTFWKNEFFSNAIFSLNQFSVVISKNISNDDDQCSLLIPRHSQVTQNSSEHRFRPLIIHLMVESYEIGLKLISKCLTSITRSSTIWIVELNSASSRIPTIATTIIETNLSQFFPHDSAASKLNLEDSIYIIDSQNFQNNNLTPVVFEIFGIKGHVMIRNVSSIFIRNPGFISRRLNFDGIQLEVAHVNQPSIYAKTGRDVIKKNRYYWGEDDLSYRLFAFMQDVLNFTAQFHNTSSWVWATSNTTYSMADLIQNNTVDLALSSTGVWSNPYYSFLFVTRVHTEVYIYYNYNLQQSSAYGNLFKDIFPLQALIAVLLTMLALLFISTIFYDESNWNDLFIWAFSIFSQQGIEEELKTKYQLSSRFYFLTICLSSILFYAYLSAFLLTKFSLTNDITGIKDLLGRGYKFGLIENSIIGNGFEMNHYRPSSPLWPIKNHYKLITTESEAIATVLASNKFAFATTQNAFTDASTSLVTKNHKSCELLQQMVILGDKRWGSAFVKKDSEFKNHFNYARLSMFQNGMVNRHLRSIKRYEQETKPTCSSQKLSLAMVSTTSHGISFHEMILVFYIFCGGLWASLIILSYEIIINLKIVKYLMNI